tara:strand:+ start:521 stop:916 length:396 start_codon:yes stop_codon:yes gene_type:complete
MTLEQGIRAASIADTDVNALVSGRIYHERMPQNSTMPAIVFSRVSTSQNSLLDGVDTLTQARIQFDIYGDTSSSVRDLATKVRALFNGHRGDLGGAAVQFATLDSELDSGFFDGDEERRRIITDFIFWLHE